VSRGARALVWFWVIVLGGATGGAALLEMLGAPPAATVAAPAVAPAPATATPQAAAVMPTPAPVAAPPPPAPPTVEATPASAVPAAPVPPPPAPAPPPASALAGRIAAPPAGTPRLAVLVHTLGQSVQATDAAIALPAPLGVAFSPYDDRSADLAARAQLRGHQVLVSLPLEPSTFPLNNPGDRALMVQLPPEENLRRLAWALSRVPGAAGVTNALASIRGERFLAGAEGTRTLAEGLRTRGLFFVEARPGEPPLSGVGAVTVDVILDEPPGAAAFDTKLAELERIARERGTALGMTLPTPVALERLGAQLPGIASRGVALVPPSLVLRSPPAQAGRTQ
jgi:polysaccharide deacetylase 2 family uncharacterized protein YibQ